MMEPASANPFVLVIYRSSRKFEIGVWQRETSTDRSSFKAERSLTFKEATSSIDDRRSNRHVKSKRSLTTSGLIEEVLNASALFLRGKNTRIDLGNGSVNMALNLLLT